jgi:hypothetical protein
MVVVVSPLETEAEVCVATVSAFFTWRVKTAVSPGMRISGDNWYCEIMTAGLACMVGIYREINALKISVDMMVVVNIFFILIYLLL